MARIRYIVKDVGEAVAFYTSHLGFKLVQQFGPAIAILQRDDLELLVSGKLMPLSQVIRFRPPRWVCRRPDACRWRSCFGPFPPFFRALPPDYVATTSLMPEEPGTTG